MVYNGQKPSKYGSFKTQKTADFFVVFFGFNHPILGVSNFDPYPVWWEFHNFCYDESLAEPVLVSNIGIWSRWKLLGNSIGDFYSTRHGGSVANKWSGAINNGYWTTRVAQDIRYLKGDGIPGRDRDWITRQYLTFCGFNVCCLRFSPIWSNIILLKLWWDIRCFYLFRGGEIWKAKRTADLKGPQWSNWQQITCHQGSIPGIPKVCLYPMGGVRNNHCK